jgi:hypothetical protein
MLYAIPYILLEGIPTNQVGSLRTSALVRGAAPRC